MLRAVGRNSQEMRLLAEAEWQSEGAVMDGPRPSKLVG